MRHHIITTTAAALALLAIAATGCKGTSGGKTAMKSDSVVFAYNSKELNVEIKADYPTRGNKILVNAVREYISEELGGTYTGDLKNGDALVEFYGKATVTNMQNDIKEMGKDLKPEEIPDMTSTTSIRKLCETDRFVTYIKGVYSYTGGAHGLYGESGTTFRKSDGRRFSRNMLRGTDSPEFKQMLKEGLKEYFKKNDVEVNNDDDLVRLLIYSGPLDDLPMPGTAPYLTKEGVEFVYQHYEIAPYAAGLPTFTIPYAKVKPYLTVTAQRMFE